VTRSPVIGGVKVGHGLPCRFVAEISNSHNGSFDRAKRMITAAKAAGADFVKFQCYTPDELVALRGDGAAPDPWGADGWTMRQLYQFAQTPLGWFPELFAHAKREGIVAFSSVFGMESLALMEGVGCPAYKVARLDNKVRWLRDAIHATKKPLIMSASPKDDCTISNIDLVLYCPAGYPQPTDAEWPISYRGVWDGTSYHGTNPEVPARHALNGARMVEVHFQLDAEPSVLEAGVSLNETQFAAMVRGATFGFTTDLPFI